MDYHKPEHFTALSHPVTLSGLSFSVSSQAWMHVRPNVHVRTPVPPAWCTSQAPASSYLSKTTHLKFTCVKLPEQKPREICTVMLGISLWAFRREYEQLRLDLSPAPQESPSKGILGKQTMSRLTTSRVTVYLRWRWLISGDTLRWASAQRTTDLSP